MLTTTSTPSKPPEPSRRFHQKDRGRAWKTYRILNRINPDRWHIGVASDRLVMLDVDSVDIKIAVRIADYLLFCNGGRVGIFSTARGYHIVSDKPCKHEDHWRLVMQEMIDYCKYELLPLDFMHAELSLKWGKTVLRITPKNGKAPPKLVRIL